MVKGLTWSKAHHKGFKSLLKVKRTASLKLFLAMMMEMTRDGLVIADQKRLAKLIKASDRTIRDAIDELIAIGAIKREGQGKHRVSHWFASYGQYKSADDGRKVVVGNGFYVVDKATGEVMS